MSGKAEAIVRDMRAGVEPADPERLMEMVMGLANTARQRLKWGRRLRQERDEARARAVVAEQTLGDFVDVVRVGLTDASVNLLGSQTEVTVPRVGYEAIRAAVNAHLGAENGHPT